MKPIILTTCDSNDKHYHLNKTYVAAIEEAGGHIIIVPPHSYETIASIIDDIDGLFLTGGDDIHPEHFGETIAPHYSGKIDEPRYQLQDKLMHAALERKLPIFGICHGLQMLNVYFGGTLHQEISVEHPGALVHKHPQGTPRDFLSHAVTLTPDSKLATILGATSMMTNSIHHQGVDSLAPNLVATGVTEDGLVESIEDPAHPFLVGVQWHPEELIAVDARWKKLFSAFVDATAEKRGD